jgi:hypothetical protein
MFFAVAARAYAPFHRAGGYDLHLPARIPWHFGAIPAFRIQLHSIVYRDDPARRRANLPQADSSP